MSEVFTLVGSLPLGLHSDGFHVALFNNAKSIGFYIQNLQSGSDRITKFLLLDESPSPINFIDSKIIASEGDRYIYVYYHLGNAIIGDGDTINAYSIAHEDNRLPAIDLQVAAISRSPQRLRDARSRIMELSGSYDDSKDGMNHLYNSFWMNSIWDVISSELAPNISSREINNYRRLVLLQVDIRNEQLLPDSAWRQVEDVLVSTRDDIISRIMQEIPEYNSHSERSQDIVINDDPIDEVINDLIYRIVESSRQGQRAAIILRSIIQHPQAADYLVKNYTDRAKMANSLLKKLSVELPMMKSEAQRENYVAYLVRWIFTNTFALNRGEVLFDLAVELRDFRAVAESIYAKAHSSSSFSVRTHLSLIEGTLHQART